MFFNSFRTDSSAVSRIILAISILLLSYGYGYGGEICFIQGQPRHDRPGLQPYETAIHCFNDTLNTMSLEWALDNHTWTYDIKVYPSHGLISITTGRFNAENIYILSTENIGISDSIILKDVLNEQDIFNQAKLLVCDDTNFALAISYLPAERKAGSRLNWKFKEINKSTGFINSKYVKDNCRMALSGPLPPYGSGTDDIQIIKQDLHGDFNLFYDIVDIGINELTDKLNTFESPKGWVMIAETEDHSVLMSVPYRNGVEQKDVLVYDGKEKMINHFEITGSKTRLRPVNNWVAGEIAQSDSRTDYESSIGYPPVYDDHIVLINPLKNIDMEINLGDSCEVLWIDDKDNIYYRLTDKLYRGRIEGDSIIERELIFQDPLVRRIHWTFEK